MPEESEQREPHGPSTAEMRVLQAFEGIRDQATLLLGPQGHFESWSVSAESIAGFRGDEVLGKHVSLLYVPEDVATGEPNHELSRAEVEGQFEGDVPRVRKDGERFLAHVAMTALRARAGYVRGFVLVMRDLSANREVEERLRHSEERFRLLVEGVRDYAIFMLDTAGRVMTWNAGAERIKGYRAYEIVGQHVSRFYIEEDALGGKAERALGIASREGRFEEEGWRVRRDGTRFWANVVVTALRDSEGHLVGYAKVTRDLTQRRKLDEERVRLAQAEEAIRLRDEFLSIASHELKTPLTALQLQLQGLQRKVALADPSLAERLERASHSGQRLADLIEALLDVSRIASGRFELRPARLDLGDLVRDVVERFRETAARAGCDVIVTAPMGLVGQWDRLRLEQVLTNLLSNAIKYGAGSPVDVAASRSGDEAVLQVADRGPGIPPEDLSRIFDRFERAVSMRNYGGLGLGLYVARQIVLEHGGTVTARNAPDGGACFTVQLPLDTVERAAALEGAPAP